jgi:hypothetical protein
VLGQDDLFTGWKVELASVLTDFKGGFSLRFALQHPEWVTIAAAHYKAELFVVPGGKYSLQLELKKGESFSFYDPQPLIIKVHNANDNGLSEAIASVNMLYNIFVVEHFNALYRKQQSRLIDSLRIAMEKLAPKAPNQFFNEYVFYKLASLEPVVRKLEPAQVYDKFFKSRPILLHQPEYVALLRETFKNYLLQSRLWTLQEYAEAFSKGWKAFELLLMRNDILAANKAFREIVALLHLAENYRHPLHQPNELKNLLNGLSASSKIPDHIRIANNIIRRASWLSTGTAAPVFSLRNESGNLLEVNEQSNAMLLIFVGPDCSYCDFELLQLREIHSRVGMWYTFVTISLPESYQHYRNIHWRNKLEWQVYSLGYNYQLLDALGVSVLPHFAIYMPKARVGMIPAPPTDQHLEAHLLRLAQQFAKP